MNVGSQNHGINDGGISLDVTRDAMTRQGKYPKHINANAFTENTSEMFQTNAQALQESIAVRKDVLENNRKEFDGKECNNLEHCKGCSTLVVIDQTRMEQNDNDDKMLCPGSRVEDPSPPTYIDSEQKLETLQAADDETGGDEDRPNRDAIKMQRIPDLQTRTKDADNDTEGNADINKSNPTENNVKRFSYKAVATIPTSPPLFRRRRRKVSMFEIQPSPAAEVIEIQDICIENGAVQTVKESALSLPELKVSVKDTDGRRKSSNHNRSRRPIADAASSYESAPHEKIRSTRSTPGDLSKVLLDDHTWTSPLTKTNTKTVQSCPSTPFTSPRMRRKSLGVLTTAAWGMTTYRDKNTVENIHHSPRRRSVTSSHGVEYLFQNSKKLSNNQSKNSSDETQDRMLKLSNEFITLRQKQQDKEENKNKLQEKCKTNAQEQNSEQENHTNPDKSREESRAQLCSEINVKECICEQENDTSLDVESDEFRPRLRSRSLEDYRFAARLKMLEGRGNDKRKDTRRKSFEMWLSDKEKQTIQKLNILALEKHREAEEEARKRQQRKGKTYEEWLNDKATEETKRRASLVTRSDTRNERQRIAQARYEKWLLEKETQALEKEKERVKEAERKTIEMRKKYEEKKKNLINEGKYSTGSVCG